MGRSKDGSGLASALLLASTRSSLPQASPSSSTTNFRTDCFHQRQLSLRREKGCSDENRWGSTPFCGGSLISSNTIVTAAHCATSPSQFKVVVGDHDVTRGDGEQRVSVASWTSHPNYNSNNQDHDIAIIQLAQPVQFSDSVAPVCLPPSSSSNYDGATATATGWGTLSSGGSRPSILQEVDLTVLTNGECTRAPNIYSSGQISNNMICASGPGKDSCQGDSGGPLVVHSGSFDLVGVVSWGYGCAQSGAPGVYSRVTDQLDWVNGQVQGLMCSRN